MQTSTSTLILRSACVGIASAVVISIASLWIFAISSAILHPSPAEGPEVGWDLIGTWHSFSSAWLLVPFGGFALGFAIGYRYFTKQSRTL